MSKFSSMSSAQLLNKIRKADGKYSVDEIEAAKVLNSRHKLPKEFKTLLPDAVIYHADIIDAAGEAEMKDLPNVPNAPKVPYQTDGDEKGEMAEDANPGSETTGDEQPAGETKKRKPRESSGKVEPVLPEGFQFKVGTKVQFSDKSGVSMEGEVIGYSAGHKAEQVYLKIKTADGVKAKRDHACTIVA